jgi:anti-sigma regulatory factor (Ser/Thr protein kinase)
MTATVAARPKMRIFPGDREQVARARDFVKRVLAGHPVVHDAVLLTSELTTNAIVHTASGDGGRFVVTVHRGTAEVRVEVWDEGAPTVPVVQSPDHDRGSGKGLSLVETIATRWGHTSGQGWRRVWFEIEGK